MGTLGAIPVIRGALKPIDMAITMKTEAWSLAAAWAGVQNSGCADGKEPVCNLDVLLPLRYT